MIDIPTLTSLAILSRVELPQNAPKPLAAKLWPHLIETATGCWEFSGARSHGYGCIRIDRRGLVIRAHRLAWELTYGPIPDELVVRHRCDNPPCCNPAHLELGTRLDNSRDCVERGRSARGSRLPHSKLIPAQVLEIRRLGDGGASIASIARQFGISWLQARRIVRRERWEWLDA